tara:strand:- start:849 stop:1271 length:423 start_codon:yes stop_codon:yes gene_type:complete
VSTSLFNFTEKGSLQITLRVFKDDMSNAISSGYLDEISGVLDLTKDVYFNDIEDYFNSKLHVFFDSNKFELDFIGLESKNEIYVCYLEVEKLPDFQDLTIDNQVLFDQFNDQQNIIHVKKSGKRDSFISRVNNSSLKVNI